MTEDAVAESVEMIIAAARAAYKDAPYRVDESQLRPLIMNHLAAAAQRGRSKAGPCLHCISPGNCGSDPQAGKQCAHGWDESLIETTDTGVVCRRCGAEGAVYR